MFILTARGQGLGFGLIGKLPPKNGPLCSPLTPLNNLTLVADF